MAVPVVLTTGARPVTAVESNGVPITPVTANGEPVTLVDSGGEPVVLVDVDGQPAFLLYSAKSYLGGIEPYHYFDFVNNDALYASEDIGTVSDPTGYSFSRASSGYYTNSDGTLTSFGSGELRRGDRGVLIEGARTNLLTYSQQFDNAAWTKTATAATANAAVAPDGTTTADLLTNNGVSTGHYVTHTVTIASGTQTVLSVYAKAGTATHVHLLATVVNAYAQFNLSTGAVVFSSAGTATSLSTHVESLADGWWRFSIIVLQTGSAAIRIYPLTAAQNAAGPSEISSATMYIWQADLQAGSHPSSPIVTTSASATRAADVLTYTAGVSYPLTLWAEFERAVDTGSVQRALMLHAGDTNNRAILGFDSADRVSGFTSSSGTTQADIAITGTIAVDTPTKAAMRVSTNSVQVCRDGTLGTEDTVATNPAVPTTIALAQNAIGAELYGYISRIAIIQGGQNDANLQTMTT